MATAQRFAQVGGHAATLLLSEDSSIVNKPSSTSELQFYTQLGPSLGVEDLIGGWTPHFYGTLTLQGKMAEDGQTVQAVPGEEVQKAAEQVSHSMLVLENLTHRFSKPNVLDIKLGTQLFDEDASLEKQERMRKAAEASTSAQTGVRLTGFQVWDSATSAFVTTPKSFGKSLAVSDLPAGLARYFYPTESHSPALSFESSSSAPTEITRPQPLPVDTLLPIMGAIIRRLQKMEAMLEKLPVRIRGSSLLIVIEGDEATLRASLDRVASAPMPSEDDEDSDAESVETSDADGVSLPHTLIPFDIKWIDFAHARRATEEEGPDEGLIKGVRSTRELLEGLVSQLESL